MPMECEKSHKNLIKEIIWLYDGKALGNKPFLGMKGQKYNWTLMSNPGRPISDKACPISDDRDGTSEMGHNVSEMGRPRWDTVQ